MIKKGDKVTILAGDDKGKTGKVLYTFPKTKQIVVEGIHLKKKHQRARRQGETGQIIDKPMPIHVSNARKEK